ncbi:MAG TPA: hypothetical protein EYN66_03210, partial [Myxococcales bacterium]|nr:hypothetical protein [Myxococcales bacterium]
MTAKLALPWLLAFAVVAAQTTAYAFSPPEQHQSMGQTQRMLTYSIDAQARLLKQAEFLRFQREEGEEWSAVFDELTGTPHRMWGKGIDIGPTQTASQVGAGVLDLVDRHAALLGVADSEVAISSVNYNERLDTWYIDIDQMVHSHPIYRGGITARVKHGRLILLGADTYPDVPSSGPAQIEETKAVNIATNAGPAENAPHQLTDVELVSLPVEASGALELRTVYKVRSRTDVPIGQWVTFVDAVTGDVLAWFNDVKFSVIEGYHEERTLDGIMVTSPMPLLEIYTVDNSVFADDLGLFSIEGSDREADIEGSYLNVRNQQGAEGHLSFTADGL